MMCALGVSTTLGKVLAVWLHVEALTTHGIPTTGTYVQGEITTHGIQAAAKLAVEVGMILGIQAVVMFVREGIMNLGIATQERWLLVADMAHGNLLVKTSQTQ